MIVSLIAFLKRIIGFVSLSSQRGKWILYKQTSCKLMVDRCAYVLLFCSVICYATLQTPYRCSSEAAETPLSRSIVSVIARLIKPFMLSLWASAWALIISFFPFGIAIDTRSRFATSHFLLPALRASVYFCEDIHITPLRFILLYLLKQHLTSEHFAHIFTWLFVYIANWIHLLSALKWMTRSEEKRI